MRKTLSRATTDQSRRGFTLVELIVVLALLAVLAAVGIASAVGYIDQSKYDKNCQNAITVYQAAQTAISQKSENGTLNKWAQDLVAAQPVEDQLNTSGLTVVNDAVHGTYYLTFNPHSSSRNPNDPEITLYGLLYSYFYDPSVFGGTMTVVFDVSATRDGIGNDIYSATVVGAFYSSQNSPVSGWDQSYISTSLGKGNIKPWNELPCTDPTFRRTNSFVGFYDGTEQSLIVPQSGPAFLPVNTSFRREGHVIGPTEDGTEVEGYLFNLRNGETLDVSWAIFDSGVLTANPLHNEDLTIVLNKSDSAPAYDDEGNYRHVTGDVSIHVTQADLEAVTWGAAYTVYENIDRSDIRRENADGLIDLEVTRGTGTAKTFTFPITRSLVTGDGRVECPDKDIGYYEYRISLDCMMIRNNDSLTDNNGEARYCSQRLFLDDSALRDKDRASTPRNVYALLLKGSSWTYCDAEQIKTDNPTGSVNKSTTTGTYAARAADDPVYFTGVGSSAGHTAYRYSVREHAAALDGDDNRSVENTDYVITGRCVVNTLFGDAVYSTSVASGGGTAYIGGTVWSDSKEAVLTSFRHLYNMRNIGNGTSVTYKIVRDLNWYFPATTTTTAVSEVKVFTSGSGYHSPVEYEGGVPRLKVVSFPAIRTLHSNQILTSVPDRDGSAASINCVQMRVASFRDGDEGYGLICKNWGVIYNIYTDNLSLILSDKADGSDSDFTGGEFCPDGIVTMTASENVRPYYSGTGTRLSNSYAVGGLVGHNYYCLGLDGLAEENNTIRMDNCVVIAGPYWNIDSKMTKGTGGVVGYNEGTNNNTVSMFGVLEVRGSFVVLGGDNVGGIIGETKAQVDARLVVDGTSTGTSVFTLPRVSSNNNQQLSCVVASTYKAGGAIASFWNGKKFNYSVNPYSASNPDPVTGRITFAELSDRDYQISVTIPANGMIAYISGGTEKIQRSVGGAIASLNDCTGDNLNIRVINNGNIIADGTNNSIFCGGAIGFEKNCTVTKLYLNVNNGTGSRIGSFNETYNTADNDTVGARSAGGAYGALSSSNAAAANRTIAINVVNDGSIVAKGTYNSDGAGGVIGSIGARDSDKNNDGFKYDNFLTPLLVNAVNKANSRIIEIGSNIDNSTGAGGAVGGMNKTDNVLITAGSVLSVENHGLIEGPYHVGGVIGDASINSGALYANNYGTINGKVSFAGGVVGRATSAHYGTIQSILREGALVTGGSFIGGAAGRLTNFQDNAVIRTVVAGSAAVTGSDSIIGGICGDLKIQGTGIGGTIELVGDSSDPVLTVSGSDGVGGSVGLMRSELVNKAEIVTPQQTATNKLTMHVSGANHVGGVVGCLRASNNGADDNNISNLFNANANYSIIQDILVTIKVKLNTNSYIYGTGENIGGAVGYIIGKFDNENFAKFSGIITVSTASGTTAADTAYIKGNRNVGGAVGHFYGVVPTVSASVEGGSINVDLSSANWQIVSTAAANNEADVGGVVGYFEGAFTKRYGTNDNSYPVTANLGSSNVTSDGYNVGGVIGRNQVRNGIITATIGGTVSGQYNIGGAIGSNEYRFSEANVTILSSGTIQAQGVNPNTPINNTADDSKGNGSNVGGVVGYYAFNGNDTPTITSVINANISGTVEGSGDNVGGAVGYCYSNKKTHIIRNITAVLQGDARVQSINGDNVGGAIGFSLSNILTVQTDISGSSKVIGNNRVGGAIGWTYAIDQKSGNDVYSADFDLSGYSISQLESSLGVKYKTSGRIDSITATVSADYALQGDTYTGGAVGQSGFKSLTGGNKWASPALLSVTAVINSGYLFDPFETGDPNGDACVGGVIGLVVDGRVEAVRLSGTGGTINTADPRYPCPTTSESGAVLVAASGNSVGGIIGQIGLESKPDLQLTNNNAQNVTVSNISSDENLHLYVVSMNGSNRIGGWIGSAFGKYGGLGNRSSNDYNTASKRATYNVNNVRFVYSDGDYVGGFCGYSRGHGSRETYLIVNVSLNNSTVTGRNGVGGAFGMVYAVNFKSGSINVALNNHTVIGDANGSSLCQEAGGAIGSIYLDKSGEGNNPSLDIPITVTIDSTSHIWSEGGDSNTSNYGVGGVLGRAYGEFLVNGTLRVTAAEPESISVYSRYSNVGGVVGVMDSVKMQKYTVSSDSWADGVTVRADGDYACAGGFVGRINSLETDMYYCSCRGTVTVYANGAHACAGGFAGYVSAYGKAIQYCYTTALVNSSGQYAGGFIGCMAAGRVYYSYVGGHTYQGSYASGQGNVSGVGNVGGFLGASSAAITIENCYSTASVLGTGNNIGGFIGSEYAGCTIKNCYCTGRVEAPYTTVDVEGVQTRVYSDHAGSFAGFINSANFNNYDKNKVMQPVNDSWLPLIGSASALYPTLDSNTGKITGAENTTINNGGSYTAVPFDSSLRSDPNVATTAYPLRAVINNTHYGDWPLPVNGTSLEGAEIFLKSEDDPSVLLPFDNGAFSFEYNGSAVTFDERIVVKINGLELERGTDYTVSYVRNDRAGSATAVIAAKPGGAYAGAVSRTFTITAIDISSPAHTLVITLNKSSYPYTGAAIVPDITVKLDGNTLVLNTDYTLSYDPDNVNICDRITVTVNGINNYTGSVVCPDTFSIDKIDLVDAEITLVGADGLVYEEDEEGEAVAHEPGVVVRYGGNTLREGRDYTVSYADNKNAGTAQVTITAVEGSVYTGSQSKPFTISPAINVWTVAPSITGWTYGDDPVAPTGKAKFGEMIYEYYADSACEGAAIDLSHADAGTYYVKCHIAGSNNYINPTPVILSVEISPYDISQTATVVATFNEQEGNTYTGEEVKPDSITVTLTGEHVPTTSPLDPDTDYTVAYLDSDGSSTPKAAGTVTVTVTGTGNYTGTATTTYEIVKRYTITYHLDEGVTLDETATSLQSQRIDDGSTVAEITAEHISRVYEDHSYSFHGWYTDEGLTDPYDFTSEVTGEFTLYAKWVKQYTLTFVTGEGGPVVDPITVDEDTDVDAPSPDPEWEGYTFGGWFTSAACAAGEECEFPYTMNRDYTVYAKWTVNQYTVTFDCNGCPGAAPDNQTVDYGSYASEPSITGYHVFGWTTDDGTSFDFANTPITGDITLHADWGYILAFDSQGGSAVDEMYVRPTEAVTQPDAPEWEGEGTYEFAGWYTTSACADTDLFELWGTTISNNYTLYAKWTEVRQYTLTFVTNGGDAVDPITAPEGSSVDLPTPVWEGHTFDGWFTSDTYDEGARVTTAYVVTGDQVFYAKWVEGTDEGGEP